ncbi:hypothetical protein QE372_004144 [Agrobacterium pusense]|nr:hypothetical protein [Agrobacterium pusense]
MPQTENSGSPEFFYFGAPKSMTARASMASRVKLTPVNFLGKFLDGRISSPLNR